MTKQSPNHKENRKRYLEKNRDRLLAATNEKYRTNMKTYVYHMVKRAEKRAKEKGLPFDLCVEDVQIPEYCPILGIKLEVGIGRGPSDSSPSLDRIYPNLGYVKDNIIVISMRANKIKSDVSVDDIEKVLLYLKEQEY